LEAHLVTAIHADQLTMYYGFIPGILDLDLEVVGFRKRDVRT
jgi:hypothetical protein